MRVFLRAPPPNKRCGASLGELNVKATIVTVREHGAGLDLLWDDKLDIYFADRGIIAAILREGGRRPN